MTECTLMGHESQARGKESEGTRGPTQRRAGTGERPRTLARVCGPASQQFRCKGVRGRGDVIVFP